jgi:hypothetical protein
MNFSAASDNHCSVSGGVRVAVVEVRVVGVPVHQRSVPVRMRVRFSRRIAWCMFMLVVLVMHVGVLVG